MDPSRRRSTVDIPKANDVGLAEWASKIKAIQQEVDRDAEDEQRKLQEEIVRSRLERAKRRNSATSVDWTKNASPVTSSMPQFPDGNRDSATEEKRDRQVNALNTLSDVSGRDPKQAISLAAFIGGRATAPRLNKPAPQVNSYDPDLFDQGRREGPHPIFGKPLTSLPSKTRLLENKSVPVVANPSPTSTLSVSTVVTSDPIKVEAQAHLAISKPSLQNVNTDPLPKSSPSKPPDLLQSSKAMDMTRSSPEDSQSIPQRTFTDFKSKPATPTKPSMVTKRSFDKPITPITQTKTEAAPVNEGTDILIQKPPPPPKPMSLAEAIGGRGPGPRLTKSQPVEKEDQVWSIAGVSLSQGRALPGMTNPQSTRPVASKPSEESITTPRLVIPGIQVIKSSPALAAQPSTPPMTLASPTPAPAFLRPIPTTDLHPSLSKLQGRGFVEQRVRATTTFTEPSPREPEQGTDSPQLRKRPSVLDRWQPGLSSQTPGSPTSKAPEQSRELYGTKLGTPPTSSTTKTSGQKNLSIASSAYRELPGMKLGAVPPIGKSGNKSSIEEPKAAPVRLPGMATKDTMDMSTKASTVPSSNIPTAEKIVLSQRGTPNMASTSLNHPTRDRAKKPRKERSVHNTTSARDVPQQKPEVSDSPTLSNTITSNDPLPQHVNPKVLVSGLKASVDNVVPIQATAESPKSPSRHVRIPSTGQRATVMDVAQALIEHEQHIWETPHDLDGEQQDDLGQQDEEKSRPDVKTMVAGWGRNLGGGSPSQRRQPGYERYSVATATTLPPLVEVQTPAETPQATLSRGNNQTQIKVPSVRAIQEQLQKLDTPQEEKADRTVELTLVEKLDDGSSNLNLPSEQKSQPAKQDEDEMVEIVFQEKLPPSFNPQQVMKESPFAPDANVRTISIEVNVISEGTSKPISQEQNIFYDTEVIVVIYRSKQKMSELVSNEAWVWRGKNSNWEREARKATEIAERFNKNAAQCLQGSEPAMLVHVLGGVLATRQGTRTHWSVENTTMHRVHRVGDCIFVDEVDLGIWNLCSAYSYCFSLLGTLYVWHGRGSSEDERKVALTYTATLSQNSLRIVELEEGAEDEMFWMILGQNGYANAHHWKFRDKLDRLGARVYFIDSTKPKSPVQPLPNVSARELQGGIFVIDCRLEIYVLIKAEARGKRTDIRLALFLAENISSITANKRPFTPPVHVVILPSRIPLELRAALRLCDEEILNEGEVPNHMNIVPLSKAMDDVHRREWPRSSLADPKFLPVGLDPSMIP